VLEAAPLFALGGGGSATDFGRAVHARFAEVEWAGGDEWRRFSVAWAATGAALRPRSGQADETALACLRAPELAPVWARPSAPAEVWRERAFEVVLDGAWVTGVFDRVVVERGAGGRAVRATVFDFKTDRVETDEDVAAAVARHAGQLNLYRRAAAALAGVEPKAVAGELVFTRRRSRVVVAAE